MAIVTVDAVGALCHLSSRGVSGEMGHSMVNLEQDENMHASHRRTLSRPPGCLAVITLVLLLFFKILIEV